MKFISQLFGCFGRIPFKSIHAVIAWAIFGTTITCHAEAILSSVGIAEAIGIDIPTNSHNPIGVAFQFHKVMLSNPPQIMPSNGMVEEFEIAHAKGLKLLPLGFTEFVSRDLWAQVRNDFERYYPSATHRFRDLFELLGNSGRTPEEQLQTTLEAIEELQKA